MSEVCLRKGKNPAKNRFMDIVTLYRYHLKVLAEQGKQEDTKIPEEKG